MGWGDVFRAIDGQVQTLIATPEGVSTGYDNISFTPPDSGLWMRSTNTPIENAAVAIGGGSGGNLILLEGETLLEIFSPFDEGTDNAWDLANKIKLAFQNKTLAGVRFHSVIPENAGNDGDTHQINVTLEWDVDE